MPITRALGMPSITVDLYFVEINRSFTLVFTLSEPCLAAGMARKKARSPMVVQRMRRLLKEKKIYIPSVLKDHASLKDHAVLKDHAYPKGKVTGTDTGGYSGLSTLVSSL